MKHLNFLLLLFVPLYFSCNGRKSGNFKATSLKNLNTGKVISIIDGDTYDILLDGNKTIRIRMEGIDAPEKGMPFYKVSKNYLAMLCFKKQIRLDIKSLDNHGRTVAYSYLENGNELSHEMIKAGLAWHFKKYSSDKGLANLEIEARKSGIGIWSIANPMSPWENRRLHRDGISTKDSFAIKLNQE